MADFVNDCPRCPARSITFDALKLVTVGYSAPFNVRELFCRCRACGFTTVFKVRATDALTERVVENLDLDASKFELSQYFRVYGYVSTSDKESVTAPADVPADVESAFREGAKCLAAECPNAAAAMFRLAVDLATQPKLPPPEKAEPPYKVRRDLGLRLQWLFKNSLLPADLKDLSDCVREDGNDGAHRGNVSGDDALDLQDFCFALLDRLYSEPARLAAAKDRRSARRGEAK